jgi:hypothetical protein
LEDLLGFTRHNQRGEVCVGCAHFVSLFFILSFDCPSLSSSSSSMKLSIKIEDSGVLVPKSAVPDGVV